MRAFLSATCQHGAAFCTFFIFDCEGFFQRRVRAKPSNPDGAFPHSKLGQLMTLKATTRIRTELSKTLLITLGVIAAAASTANTARADDLIVKFDQSQILRLPRPAAEIIVGNPSIADVAIQAGNILVVTGKSFGITNIIALDSERNIIQDQRVAVRRDEAGVVNLHKGIARHTFACLPQCNPTLTVGDDVGYMSAVLKQSKDKMTFSEGTNSDQGQQGGN